ncbi:MAG: ATP-dependent DNA ligase [Planctomycetota bacterium]
MMRAFADLYLRLDATTSTSAKLEAVAGYLRSAEPGDAAWAVAFMTGNRPKGIASSAVVRSLAVERSGVPAWMLEACRDAVGDLSEAISLLLPEASAAPDACETGRGLGLRDAVERYVLPLGGACEAERREIIGEAWDRLRRHEVLVYLKMIRGGFRVGVQRRLLSRAIASVAGVSQATIEHRLAGGFDPSEDAYLSLLAGEREGESGRGPYPFFLAHSVQESAEGLASSLGDPSDWIAEWKWDGIRVQLCRREGETLLWSRGEELISHQFPEVIAGARGLPDGTVLDGELLLWDGSSDRPADFASLQTRLNRKRAPAEQPGLFEARSPVMLAFDVLESGGRDVRPEPQSVRRGLLEGLLAESREGSVRCSPTIGFDSWESLGEARGSARELGVEGVMLKHRGSPYVSGRVRPEAGGGWLKWKLDPRTVDAVLLHALPGSGRRATMYTDYAFAVWSDDRSELVVFTRAYSGLSNAEIESLDAWIRRNTTRRTGPVREVKAERVFEIGFEGIARSGRHKAGLAVRFPRILRERTDKRADAADTLGVLRAMLPSD